MRTSTDRQTSRAELLVESESLPETISAHFTSNWSLSAFHQLVLHSGILDSLVACLNGALLGLCDAKIGLEPWKPRFKESVEVSHRRPKREMQVRTKCIGKSQHFN